jgi:hypothetical protein
MVKFTNYEAPRYVISPSFRRFLSLTPKYSFRHLFPNSRILCRGLMWEAKSPAYTKERIKLLSRDWVWLYTGFGFTKYLQIVTTSNYNTTANSHTAIQYRKHLNLLSLLCLHQFYGNGFQRRTFPFLWFPEPQLPVSNSNSWTTEQQHCSGSLTNQPSHSTLLTMRLAGISHQPPTLLNAVSRLSSIESRSQS